MPQSHISNHKAAAAVPGLKPADILIVLFKHKWKLLFCSFAGLAAAAAFHFTNAPIYESDAKLLVRYVVERSAIDSVDSGAAGDTSNRPSDSILNSEVEILNSWDLFEQVAGEIGVDRLCPGRKDATTIDAANTIASGVTVSTVPRTNVILISYRDTHADLAPQVLQALLEAYFNKHLDIHRSKAAFDLVSQQTDVVRSELLKTEDDLKKKKAEANIISVKDTSANLNAQLADTERQINSAQTDLAEQRALVAELEKSAGAADDGKAQPSASPQIQPQAPTVLLASGSAHASAQEVERYQECIEEIAALRKKQFELLSVYSPESRPVQLNEAQIDGLQKERAESEKKFPDLLEKAPSDTAGSNHQYDLASERARLVSMEAGMENLQKRLQDCQEQAKQFAKVAPDIEELERTEQLQQADYATSLSKLQNASVDEALDPSKIPNISIVQKPSPAMRVAGTRQKIVLGLAAGGMALGLAIAFFKELVLDQSVKRPMEIEQRLGITLALSIPYISGKNNGRSLPPPAGAQTAGALGVIVKNGHATVAPWEPGHFVRPYAETIRDRLGFYFEANNMTHRPKLLAITGSNGSGASTLAAGLASALSETGEGKVLLVDMNMGRAEAHPFFKGRLACSLTAALTQEGERTSAAENLYLATTGQGANGSLPFGLKRLRELIPNIKESDFDYVLFDMPPVSETSPTAAMAAYMDQVIFVVEAEKGQREAVQRDYAQLAARKPDLFTVLNKVRSYVPKWIEGGA